MNWRYLWVELKDKRTESALDWVYQGFKRLTCHGRIIVLADENGSVEKGLEVCFCGLSQ